MSALLDRYKHHRRAARLREMRELAALLAPEWPMMHMRLMDSGVPTADRQGFRTMQPYPEPPVANQATVAAAADTALWLPATTAPNMALAANTVRPGQVFKVTAWGVTTTAVTGSQTLIVNPRFGTTTSGTLLGASRTSPVQAAVNTNVAWNLEMWVYFRTIGAAGTCVCTGKFDSYTAVGTAATTNASTITFGTNATTPITVDTTVAAGLLVSVFPSLATQTFTTMCVFMETLN